MHCPKCCNELPPESDTCSCGFSLSKKSIKTIMPISDSQLHKFTHLIQPQTSLCSLAGRGPVRPTFTNNNPARYAVFNSITDNAAVGNEQNFVRIAEKGNGSIYSSDIKIEPGKQYEVYIYYHNDASGTYNDAAHGYSGVARDVRLSTMFPPELMAGEKGAVLGTITASNTNPKAVWDYAYITATDDLSLHYVTGSAKLHNAWTQKGGRNLSPEHLFSKKGALLGLAELNGIILGCAEYSGHIVYTIQTRKT